MIRVRSRIYRHLTMLAIALLLAIACHFPAQSQTATSQTKTAVDLAQKAQQLYDSGQLSQAANTWESAAASYAAQGDRLGKNNSLINQSQALQNLGLYPKACRTLLEAFEVKQPECSPTKIDQLIENLQVRRSRLSKAQGIGLRSLGSVVQRRGMLLRARRLLEIAQFPSQNSPELSKTLLATGNVEAAIGKRQRDRLSYDKITEIIDRQDLSLALAPYESAVKAYQGVVANKMAEPIAQIQAQLNHLSLLIDVDNWWQKQTKRRWKSWQRLEQTELSQAAANFSKMLERSMTQAQSDLSSTLASQLKQLTVSHQGIYARINYAQSLNKLGNRDEAAAVLQTALPQAKTIGDQLGESYILGYLGDYYGQQQKNARAIALTNQALVLAQAQTVDRDTREVTYLWQAQLGQLLEQQTKDSEAIAAYTSAFNTLQSLRTDLNANDRLVQFDFLQEIKPVYLSLANLLLRSPDVAAVKSLNVNATSTSNKASPNLELARQVIESLQLAELDNYFQDPCAETSEVALTIDQLDPQAAVIYPIVLGDRLEVILSMAGQPLQQFSTPVAQSEVDLTIDLLYDSLYNQSVDNSAVNIFSTTPVDPVELAQNTRTLLPLLQQIHSWLIAPLADQLAAHQVKTLVFVLNGKLQSVPLTALYDGKQYLLEKYQVALAPSLQLLNTESKPRSQIKVLAAGLNQQVEIQGQIFPALAYVSQELEQIETVFPQSRQLLNQEFTTSEIQQQLQQDFSVVHLATHGVFSSDPQQTFIVTGDRHAIDINTLSRLLNSSSRTKPELIVLSACDTATGDERAVLGFAGVAVRSGSSTLGSLWSVEDASTAQLMGNFYRQFENPQSTKAEALQQAQLSLIESLKTNPPLPALKQLPPHPYYWASYVLVGNWR